MIGFTSEQAEAFFTGYTQGLRSSTRNRPIRTSLIIPQSVLMSVALVDVRHKTVELIRAV